MSRAILFPRGGQWESKSAKSRSRTIDMQPKSDGRTNISQLFRCFFCIPPSPYSLASWKMELTAKNGPTAATASTGIVPTSTQILDEVVSLLRPIEENLRQGSGTFEFVPMIYCL